MKKIALLIVLTGTLMNHSQAQDWFTSMEIAAKLALAQDKMLFVMWEDSFNYPQPVMVRDGRGIPTFVDITLEASLDSLIWSHFIPLKLSESKYIELSEKVKETRGLRYYNKLVDESIKIMDVNGNILNVNSNPVEYENLTKIIERYALNTAYLKPALVNYAKQRNYTTAFRLGSRYYNFAVFSDQSVRAELLNLAGIYIDEAKVHAQNGDLENKAGFVQKCELFRLIDYLILDRPKKVLRQLIRLEQAQIDPINKSLVAFLHFTAYRLLKDEKRAALWRSEVSLVDLKKASLIINTNQ